MTPTSTPNRAARRSIGKRTGAAGAGTLLIGTSAAALLTALAAPASAAATFTVDSNADGTADPTHCTDGTSGNCTFRDALYAAADGDTVTFDPAISSITSTEGTFQSNAITITGPGSSLLNIISGDTPGTYATLYSAGTGSVAITGLTITGNRVYTNNDGDLTLDDVHITGSSGAYGGALYASNDGDLTVTDSLFDNNYSTNSGGAIYAYNTGDVVISNTDILNNDSNTYSGAVHLSSNVSQASITDSDLSNNTANSSGGALYAHNNGNLTIVRSTINDNYSDSSGGAMFITAYGDVSITDTTFDGNHATGTGGGLYLTANVTLLTISNSTISNNISDGTGYGGGGVFVWGDNTEVEINNSTLTGNVSAKNGGALYFNDSYASISINQSTIVGNTAVYGGGIWAGSEIGLSGTIVSANTASGDATSADIGMAYASTVNSDHSLIGSYSSNVTLNDIAGTIISSSPGVGALADNGGPTKTMALDPTSPAVDAGPDPVATFPGNAYDQRGLGTVRIAYDRADIGAFEIQEPPPEPTTTTTVPDTTTTEGTDPVVPEFTG